jgi:hypothetical protein
MAPPLACAILSFVYVTTALDVRLEAASSASCEGGGFSVITAGGAFAGEFEDNLPGSSLGSRIEVRGRYVEFDIVSARFEIENYLLTGAPNPEDITGGVQTPIFKRKTPDHRGQTVAGDAELRLRESELVIQREGGQISMKIQAKDCAQGGVFQMEPERDDGTATVITHVLATAADDPRLTAFYFDNPNFRARESDVVPYKDTTVVVPPRINFANDFSPRFVGRDSPQVAERIDQACPNQFVSRVSGPQTVNHCGGVSLSSVASGGRMGLVLGGDATEVAPPATDCTQNCQAQNRVRRQAVNLGFPFPVPDAGRLKPRFPACFAP